MNEKCRILIADDHALVRSGLKSLLNSQADLEVVGEASDITEAVRKAQDHPDVIILDISMPRGSGLQAISKIREVSPRTRILILTMHQDSAFLRSALAAGADGYLTKRAVSEEALRAVRSVHKGERYIDPSLPDPALKEDTNPGFRLEELKPPPLSAREKEVLILVAQGFTNAEIGEKLNVGVRSVETYRNRIATKLGLKHRTDLVRYALELNLLKDEAK